MSATGAPCGAGPDREPGGAQILSLHRQQPVNNLDHTFGWRPHQLLGCQPAAVTLALHSRHSRYSTHARDPSQGRCPETLPRRQAGVVLVSTGAQIRLIPPVVHYFAPFTVTWVLQRWRPWTIPGGDALSVAGLALVAGGIALMLWAFVTLRRANTTVIPWEQVSAIISTGPFRFSRNPIYLADAITYIGGSLLIRSWWPLLILPGIVLVMRRKVIDREERYLTERFGDAHREYQLQVARWL